MRYTFLLISMLAAASAVAQTEENTNTTQEQTSTSGVQPIVPQTPPARPQAYSQSNIRTTTSVSSAPKVEQNDDDNKPQTIENQIEHLIEKSGNYQAYKVIEKNKILQLQENILDTLQAKNTLLERKENTITAHKAEITQLQEQVSTLRNNLEKSEAEAFSLFGMHLTKGAYSSLLIGTIVALLALLAFYVFKFFDSNIATKTAQKLLADLQEEYEEHRAKAIEREQKLRRELQDEINKNKGF